MQTNTDTIFPVDHEQCQSLIPNADPVLKNKARGVLWLAIPKRYLSFKSTKCTGLDRGIVSIPYRHCTDNPNYT
jgi:hypothetical protein